MIQKKNMLEANTLTLKQTIQIYVQCLRLSLIWENWVNLNKLHFSFNKKHIDISSIYNVDLFD